MSQEVRIRNVSLHRRGKPEYGTLYLTKHHLIFSYQPATSTRTSLNQQSSTSKSDLESTAVQSNAQGSGQEKTTSTKLQAKEIYVPFALIHHCTLRPSTTLSAYKATIEQQPPLGDDELFPPTIGTNTYRGSTDSTRSITSPQRSLSPAPVDSPSSARPPAIRIRCKDFAIFALHFHGPAPDDAARQVFYALRSSCCVSSMEEMYAFQFVPPAEERATGGQVYDARREYARMGVSEKAPEGPGSAWRITNINSDYSYSPTYPAVLCIPKQVSDNILKYCGSFRSKSRIPALAYLHSNGGSITRSSQPLVGVQGKRNPQDERLVTAIFCSHTPSGPSPSDSPQVKSSTVDGDIESAELDVVKLEDDEDTSARRRVYGSTRRNLIVDARPRINMIANKAAGGGIEDVANYSNGSDTPVEKVFLNIANIHAMRASLDKVVEALGSSDYLDLLPNQELLRKSGWLGHIAGILDGAEMVARVVGLGGSHALIHCSDGWDRTSQISALAQVMLDPYYRTLQGFITLVQKDFLSFGHKFRHRQGTEGSEKWFEIENERVQPPRLKDNTDNIQTFGTKALSGARTWFEKNKSSIFRQPPTSSRDSSSDTSRPVTPPPNPVIHSTPSPAVKEEKHKMDEKEVAPIFHQFLDAVWQLVSQEPSLFEFNERFLRRLLYQSYSGQYGEFLFNTEKERAQYQDRTASVWANFLARKHEFINKNYAPHSADTLLFPRRHGYEREIDVKWWSLLFGHKDEEMNIAKPADIMSVTPSLSSVSLHENASREAKTTIRAARSTSALNDGVVDSKTPSSTEVRSPIITSRTPSSAEVRLPIITSKTPFSTEVRSPIITSKTPSNAEVRPIITTSKTLSSPRHVDEPSITTRIMDDREPLGINTKSSPTPPSLGSGLDFAAFAQQNAFRD